MAGSSSAWPEPGFKFTTAVNIQMIISIIASMSKNGVIGYKNRLPWKTPEDIKWFKEKTEGHYIVMGRKTFESIGKLLPGRKCVVLTRNRKFNFPGVTAAHSIEDALEIARQGGESELFIVGGEDIYRQTLEIADRIYLTVIDSHYEGDSFFPSFDESKYRIVFKKLVDQSPRLEFFIFEKKDEKDGKKA